MEKVRVCWVSPNFNHYKQRFLSHLAKEKMIDLEVLAGQSPVKEGHSEDGSEAPFKITRISTIKRWFGIYPDSFLKLFKVVCCGEVDVIMMPTEKRFMLLIFWLVVLRMFFNFRLVSYSHQIIRSSRGRSTRLDMLITKWIFSLYDYIIFYTKHSQEWALNHELFSISKSDYANNTLDTKGIWKNFQFEINKQPPSRLLFIGRLIDTKRIDLLIDYFKGLKNFIPDVSLVIIGDGPNAKLLVNAIKEQSGIRWLGLVVDESLIADEMKQAHVVFIPGESGLSVVHAFAYGKPYFTLDLSSSAHGPELSYLRDGVNGLFLKDTKTENIARIVTLLKAPDVYSNMCKQAFKTAQRVSVDRWCQRMVNALVKSTK